MKLSNFLFDAFKPRLCFEFHNKKIQWYPGHMRKGINDIGKTLRRTHCIIEVHDARIPFSGRNISLIKRLVSNKPIILILNKADLLPKHYQSLIKTKIIDQMEKNDICLENIFFLDSIKRHGYNQEFLDTIIKAIEKTPEILEKRDFLNVDNDYNLLVMGIPNVGKSTLINGLRNVYLKKKGKATITGPTAGVTRAVLERIKICDFPKKIYLFDTPGILEPGFNNFSKDIDRESFMKCALCATISDEVVGMELIADYLLFWFNKNSRFEYMDFLGLKSPTNDISEALTYAAIKYDCFLPVRNIVTGNQEMVPNFQGLAYKFISAFRKGQFGKILLDTELV